MSPQSKLAVAAALTACATAYLAYLGASTSWSYYLLVDECVENHAKFTGQRLRVSGRVASRSLQLSDDRSRASFVLCGQQSKILVSCKGPLPDNLAEDMDVVVEGTVDGEETVRGDKVLTRCASKYEANDGSSVRERK
jgi:cytochrome c-type biogenesis protein CcmE